MKDKAAVTVAGSVNGRYEVLEQRDDGTLVLGPDVGSTAVDKRMGTRPMTPAEFDQHFGDLPTDDEG